MHEFFEVSRKAGFEAYQVWSYICAGGFNWEQIAPLWQATGMAFKKGFFVTAYLGKDQSVELVLLVFALGCCGCVALAGKGVASSVKKIAISSAALLFIALPLSYLVRLHGYSEIGRLWVLFVLAVVWVGDTAGYFVGRAFGKHKLAPMVSPGKTWEGAAANVLMSIAVGVAFPRWLPYSMLHLAVCSMIVSIAGQYGDLMESAVKRAAGVKDSGSLLPGHGGMWDRIDALIFAAPVAWVYLKFVIPMFSR
jgi:phosphatidate cytidylyltransferase